jgi:ankyrin repeat protein
MRNSFLVVMLACVSMQASATTTEPQQKSEHSKSTHGAPAKARLTPPSKATLGFYQASTSDNYDMMDLFLQQGADINCQNCEPKGNTPLNAALGRNYGLNYQSISWLINHGADVNVANAAGITPLMRSIPISFGYIRSNLWNGTSYEQSQITKLLLDNGAKTVVKDVQGNTPLNYIIMSANSNNNSAEVQSHHSAFILILNSLLEHSADINSVNNMGNTVLMDAADSCADFSVETLLANNADPATKNKLGQTALDIAIEKATRSGQNSNCNDTVKILQNPQHVSSVRSNTQGVSNNGTPQNPGDSIYTGNYTGNYTGDDNGSFQVVIDQGGNINLNGKSLRSNQAFTGNGKISSDGSLGVTLGNISSGATFQGSINAKTGAMYGTWKNSGLAGNFSGHKQSGQTQASNPIEAIGGLLNMFSKALAQ